MEGHGLKSRWRRIPHAAVPAAVHWWCPECGTDAPASLFFPVPRQEARSRGSGLAAPRRFLASDFEFPVPWRAYEDCNSVALEYKCVEFSLVAFLSWP